MKGLEAAQAVNKAYYSQELKPALTEQYGYFLGLMISDGCITTRTEKGGTTTKYMSFASKDEEMIKMFCDCVASILSKKANKFTRNKRGYYYVGIVSRLLCKHLISIGITERKSLTIEKVDVDDSIFHHVIRGIIDGDGSYVSHKNGNGNTFSIRTVIASGSIKFIQWLQNRILCLYGISSFICSGKCYRLVFNKKSTDKLVAILYDKATLFLRRKQFKINDLCQNLTKWQILQNL